MLKLRQKSGFRSPSVVDRMGAVLLDSESAFRTMIHERASLIQAIAVMFSIAFLTGGFQMIHLDRTLRWLLVALQPPYSNLNSIIPGFLDFLREVERGYPQQPFLGLILFGGALAFAVFYTLFIWLLWASISYTLAKLFFRGTGSWRNDLALFAYCSVVDVFALFVGLIMLLVHPLIAFGALLGIPIILLPWKVIMAVQALKENHGISTAHAFYCVFLIPIGIPLLLMFIALAGAFSLFSL